MKRTLTWLIGIIVLIGLYFLVRSAITIVPIADVEAQQQAEVFDAPAYVEANWQQRILPAADEKAVDLAQVLNAFEVDSNGKPLKMYAAMLEGTTMVWACISHLEAEEGS